MAFVQEVTGGGSSPSVATMYAAEREVWRYHTPDEVAVLAGPDGPVDELDAALVTFARRVAAEPSRVESGDLDRLRRLGLDDRDLFLVVAAVGARCFFATVLGPGRRAGRPAGGRAAGAGPPGADGRSARGRGAIRPDDPSSDHRTGELLPGTVTRWVGDDRRLPERQLQRLEAVAQRSRMLAAEVRCRGGDQARECRDQPPRLIEVELVPGIRPLREAALDCGSGHEVDGCGGDDLDGRDLGEVGGRPPGVVHPPGRGGGLFYYCYTH
jgi:hypothetical protein